MTAIAAMKSIALPERNIIVPRLEFPAWLRFPRGVSDERAMLMPQIATGGMHGGLNAGAVGLATGAALLLLDLVTNAAAAYSFRKLRSGYSGSAVRLRRSSDNAEQDIGFSGTDFDTAAASSFIGGGSGYVKTWYDQSANGRNATNATVGFQPSYVEGGINSKPAAFFDAADDYLSNNFAISQPLSILSVALFPALSGVARCIFDGLTTRLIFGVNNTHIYLYAGTSQETSVALSSNTAYVLSAVVNGSSSVAYQNGTVRTIGNPGAGGLSNLGIGGSFMFNSKYISELVLIGSALSSDAMASAVTNIKSGWGIS